MSMYISEGSVLLTQTFQFEADRRAITITINSLRTDLLKDDIENLYPKCGLLLDIT